MRSASNTSKFVTAAAGTFALAAIVGVVGLALLPHYTSACDGSPGKLDDLHFAQHFVGAAVPLFLIAAITAFAGLLGPRVAGTGRLVCGFLMLASGGLGLFAFVIWAFYPGLCS